MSKVIYRVSFYVELPSTTAGQEEQELNRLIDQLGDVPTDLSWEDVEWEPVYRGGPVYETKETTNV